MTRPRAIASSIAALLLLAALAGCTAPKQIDAVWPTATMERAVPRPAGSLRWPLTGLPAPSPEAVSTRIVSVVVDNASAARPQVGISKADVVYESVTESGTTRFNALFQSQTPTLVGPTRAARPCDVVIIPEYRALFAHVGEDANTKSMLTNRALLDDMDQLIVPGAYRRDATRTAPNNRLAVLAKLRTLAVSSRGFEASVTITGFAFSRVPTVATPTVSSVTIPFSTKTSVMWKYNASTGTYLRWLNGKKQSDKGGGQYSAHNVVVMWALMQTYAASATASASADVQLTGSGRVTVFHDGQRVDGSWTASTTAPPVLRDSSGNVIQLSQGNTWFEVIGNEQNISMK